MGLQDFNIVIFDGYCNFCNGSVNFLIRVDKKRNLKYVALQSQLGKKITNHLPIPIETDSIIFIKKGILFFASDAVLQICGQLPYPNKIFFYLLYFPKNFRDWMYAIIARNRYRWFGKRDYCRVPADNEYELFPPDIDL